MKSRIVFIISILFLSMGILAGCDKKAAKEEGVYYTCPMHPEVKKAEPGQCPVCGMDLVKKEDHSGHKH